MNSSSGLGQPGPGQPEFDGPVTDGSWSANVPPARFGSPSGYPPAAPPQGDGYPPPAGGQQPVPQQHGGPAGPWGPPSLVPPGPPAGGPPRRTGVRALLVGGTLVVVVALGLLAWQLLPGTPAATPTPSAVQPATAAPPPASAEPTVVRTPDTPAPTTSAQVTGGSIGQPIRFRTSDGEAQVTVTRATWADNGVLPPAAGMSYLVVDVTFEGVSGAVTTGPFFTAIRQPGGDRQMLTIGAQLDSQLAMRTIRAGQDNIGQVAFEVARGPVTFEVLSELLEPLATVDIPG